MGVSRWVELTCSAESMNQSRGFTLIETMVALVIVALGMTAVYLQLGQFATNAIYLRDKSLASWIGSNTVTEISVSGVFPELGEQDETVEFADREWALLIEVSETDVENLRRVDVSVALEDRPERIIHTVSGLIEQPAPPEIPPTSWRSVGGGGPRG